MTMRRFAAAALFCLLSLMGVSAACAHPASDAPLCKEMPTGVSMQAQGQLMLCDCSIPAVGAVLVQVDLAPVSQSFATVSDVPLPEIGNQTISYAPSLHKPPPKIYLLTARLRI